MRVGVLDDQTEDLLRGRHGDMESYGGAPVVKVDVARSNREVLEELLQRVRECLKRWFWQQIGFAVTREIGRDHVGGFGERGYDVADDRRRSSAMLRLLKAEL